MPANRTSQLVCVHSALAIVVLMASAMVFVADWMPPPSPALSAADIAQWYATDANRIRFASVLMLMASVLFWPFAVAIAMQMQRIEGPVHPLADTQRAAATGTVVAILFPSLFWMVAAYRPGISPEIVQAINDLGWMIFIGTVPPALLQALSIAFCVFQDKGEPRVFPRWFGFFNLWMATGFLVGEAIAFFKTGPFAWDGLAAFWMAATFFFGWILVTWYVVTRAIQRHAACPHREQAAP